MYIFWFIVVCIFHGSSFQLTKTLLCSWCLLRSDDGVPAHDRMTDRDWVQGNNPRDVSMTACTLPCPIHQMKTELSQNWKPIPPFHHSIIPSFHPMAIHGISSCSPSKSWLKLPFSPLKYAQSCHNSGPRQPPGHGHRPG